MSDIKRVYVEKKPGEDAEARALFDELVKGLGLSGVTAVRVINCYDVSGLTDAEFETAARSALSEPPLDIIIDGGAEFAGDLVFAVRPLPGQFDQRADSAVQCIQASIGAKAEVESSKVYVVSGDLSDGDIRAIKGYIINPVESAETPLEKPARLGVPADMPAGVPVIAGFRNMDGGGLRGLIRDMALAMSEADLAMCRDLFRAERRDPTVSEIRVVDTYWSDHCRHTTFGTELTGITVGDGEYAGVIRAALDRYLSLRDKLGLSDRPVTLMDAATIGAKAIRAEGLLPDLDASEEINACSIEADCDVDGRSERWLVMFKNETHNHPTEIEPFGGAATCLGGAIRDPLSGRSYVYQALRVTGGGDPLTPVSETLPGKLPQRKITRSATAGYSSYGNQIGLATGLVREIYDEGYAAKRMEIGAVVGAVRKDHVRRERPAPGDVVILVGGRTGRDGCGGATGSSKAHNAESLTACGAEVQKGNSPEERKLQRLFRDPNAARLIKRCNDFGAGGAAVAIGELADGVSIDLGKVQKKYDGLDGTELAISESQERMAVCVAASDADQFIALAAGENLEAAIVAEVTGDSRLVMIWRGKTIVNIPRAFLNTNGARQSARAEIPADFSLAEPPAPGLSAEAWLSALSRLNSAAQIGLGERFDSTVGAGAVFMPFGGKRQLTPSDVSAALLPVPPGSVTDTATFMTFGFDAALAKASPFHGGVLAVCESVARLAACGIDYRSVRLTFQEYFERLGGDPVRWGKPLAAMLGALTAQMELGVPAIGGKDSMSGTYEYEKDGETVRLDVPPTLVSFAVAVSGASRAVPNVFAAPGNNLYILRTKFADGVPVWDDFRRNLALMRDHAANGSIVSAVAVGADGLAAALSRSAFGNGLGLSLMNKFSRVQAKIELGLDCLAPLRLAFAVETSGELPAPFELIGQTTGSDSFDTDGVSVPRGAALDAWLGVFEPVFPNSPATEPLAAPVFASRTSAAKPLARVPRPRVVIPAFPGTNGEYDAAAAFARAGAEPDIFVVKNLSLASLRDSVSAFAKRLGDAQILMLPGGFSAGDEPDGSGKFISAFLRSPRASEAIAELLDVRGGLVLGICNGFQALIKLGLVPYGRITDPRPDSPTLAVNRIGRHVSRLARTRVVSKLSPWLAGTDLGGVRSIPISHGEGRFVCSEDELSRLAAAGQIATVYCSEDGSPSSDFHDNPNGSLAAVEGLTSPDGRVYGKMGHSERVAPGLFRNVPGVFDQKLFESGAAYFR